jgi:D-alanyl-D-alanine carboxypeptidase
MHRNLHVVCGVCLGLVVLISAPVAWPQDGTPNEQAQIDQILSKEIPANGPGAAVLVVNHGETVLRKGYGLADLELGVPIDPTQVFRICSITKQFTAVAILQLVEAGKLKLDDPITSFVPDYPTGGATVTIGQLLTHTSGIPSIQSQSEWAEMWRKDMSVAELLTVTKNKPLDFAPGTNFKYSNTGYVLLGAVIEKASGQSYADYIQSHIFAPAGMTSSYYDTPTRIIPHRVPGYMRDDKEWQNAPFISMTQPYSAGSLLSTVEDMWKWEQALAAGKLIGPALLAKAYTQAVLPDGRGTHYGFGWELSTLGVHPTVEHGGGMPGFSAYEIRIPDSDIYIVILANAYNLPTSPRSLAHRIAEAMLHLASSESAALPATTLQDYAGAYRIAPNANFIATVEDGKLMGQLGPGKRPLVARAIDTFEEPGGEMQFIFKRDASKHVDRVKVRPDAPGPELDWPRSSAP